MIDGCDGLVYYSGHSVYGHNNEMASRLSGLQIRGDAVLQVTHGSSLHIKVRQLIDDQDEGKKKGGQWADLPQELLGMILCAKPLDWSAESAKIMASVCRSWRQKILLDPYITEGIKFKSLKMKSVVPNSPFSFSGILSASLRSNNLTACIVAARYQRLAGNHSCANKYWKIVAKKSHPEGLAMMAFEYYSGRSLERDPEEAYLYLTRACRKLEACITSTSSRLAGEVPVLMTIVYCQNLLQHAAHILAILIIDNDFLSPLEKDTSAAIRWLKISHSLGCSEAGKLLQSMFRSGQY
jgi:hypothetical protein